MPDAPKPAVGYLVVNDDWTPPSKTPQSWIYSLPQMYMGLKDAEAVRAGLESMSPAISPKVILEATITFRVVKDGGRD